MSEQLNVAIIGLGLIGGAIAMRLRDGSCHVVAYDVSETTLKQALAKDIIDEAALSLELAASQADIIILATPISTLPTMIENLQASFQPKTLIMDVASVKQGVVASLNACDDSLRAQFVLAHPMSGRQHSGLANATPTLLEHKNAILTPLPETQSEMIRRATNFWQAIGMRVAILTPEEHDKVVGYLSHLPHALAFSYLQLVEETLEKEAIDAFHGTGFKDFTRIGRATPGLWADILLSNKTNLLEQLDKLENHLAEFKAHLKQGDADKLISFMTRRD